MTGRRSHLLVGHLRMFSLTSSLSSLFVTSFHPFVNACPVAAIRPSRNSTANAVATLPVALDGYVHHRVRPVRTVMQCRRLSHAVARCLLVGGGLLDAHLKSDRRVPVLVGGELQVPPMEAVGNYVGAGEWQREAVDVQGPVRVVSLGWALPRGLRVPGWN